LNTETINLPIADKEKFLQECIEARKRDFALTELNGLYYIDKERLQEMFQPHLDKLGNKVKISRGWAHFMAKGSKRAIHKHTMTTGLYYLHIPANSAKMWFEDTHVTVEPIEDDFVMFTPMRPHGITEHENTEERWAVAFECELVNN